MSGAAVAVIFTALIHKHGIMDYGLWMMDGVR